MRRATRDAPLGSISAVGVSVKIMGDEDSYRAVGTEPGDA
jgi:hypothetical protein